MGNVFAEITVKYTFDIECARAGQITADDVRSVTLTVHILRN